jgi:hypothetical protein
VVFQKLSGVEIKGETIAVPLLVFSTQLFIGLRDASRKPLRSFPEFHLLDIWRLWKNVLPLQSHFRNIISKTNTKQDETIKQTLCSEERDA